MNFKTNKQFIMIPFKKCQNISHKNNSIDFFDYIILSDYNLGFNHLMSTLHNEINTIDRFPLLQLSYVCTDFKVFFTAQF